MLTHLSIFTGIGGIDLAADEAGFTTTGQCEINPYCIKILEKNFPNIRRWTDVKTLTSKEIISTIGKPTLVSGGFPCQDTSCAGLQQGINGERSGLVFHLLRLLKDIKPNYALFENVGGFRTNGLKEVLKEIAKIGYDAEWYSLRASGFGSPHKRERIFIVAHTKRNEQQSQESCGRQIGRMGGIIKPVPWNRPWESALCEFRGMDDGASYGVDRLDSIRNAVVPQQIFPILKAIAEIESQNITQK